MEVSKKRVNSGDIGGAKVEQFKCVFNKLKGNAIKSFGDVNL